jgi:uncharacterized protein YjbI with pentapeptide repeats
MANQAHLDILQQGVEVWNAWRAKEPSTRPDLSQADLSGVFSRNGEPSAKPNLSHADLSGADLSGADLSRLNLFETNLNKANLSQADLNGANLGGAFLNGTILFEANLGGAALPGANLREANLGGAFLSGAYLSGADLSGADLSGAILFEANLRRANLRKANLRDANLGEANLCWADLSQANLEGADLSSASLVATDLLDATLTDCRVYGISAWDVKLSEGTKQQGLIITSVDEPAITIDDLKVAQFVYLLLHNENIRDVIDAVAKKGVLLLGRFTDGRIAVLERLRGELRQRGYLPMVFNFNKPETKDFTETVRLLAGMSKFVIADITNPKSAPLELQATVPEIMVPFRPIIAEGEKPFAMMQDLWSKHREWVFEPIYYSSVDTLIASLDEKIIKPAEVRFAELLKRKADTMGGEHI